MGTTLALTVASDDVVSFEINPGTLPRLLETRAEAGPLLKCFEGSVTLVSPGRPHESMRHRLDRLILVVCLELGVEHTALGSTTWSLPPGAGDTAYEPDEAYYVQSHGVAAPDQPPDLAVEVVVTHPVGKALRAAAALGIPEVWVLDVPGGRLTFHHLVTRGKARGTYRPRPTSRAFPALTSAGVLERLNDPTDGDTMFLRNCREWARRVLGSGGD